MALTNKLDAIGDAIRRKNGETDKYTLPQMVEKIDALPTGGDAYISIDKDWNMTGTITTIDDYFTNSGSTSNTPALQANVASLKLDKATSVGQYAFYYCKKLKSVDMAACKSLGQYAFRQCTSLNTVSLPACTNAPNYVFYGCTSLTSVDMPACTAILSFVFTGCTSLTSANLPLCTSVGQEAFNGCKKLQTVNLPKLTAIPNIPSGTSNRGCFGDCSSLQSIDLPACTSIGTYAFQGCSTLATLILRSETVATLVGTNALSFTPIAVGTGYIYVPDALVDSYKTDTNWVIYAAQIKPLSELPTS